MGLEKKIRIVTVLGRVKCLKQINITEMASYVRTYFCGALYYKNRGVQALGVGSRFSGVSFLFTTNFFHNENISLCVYAQSNISDPRFESSKNREQDFNGKATVINIQKFYIALTKNYVIYIISISFFHGRTQCI